ncbi:MAG: polysaccharide biosynthesis C-terminal domain-containing protein [Solirubrobacteraceae bacterium]|nr:polysaccharide biosynthesis C-terminal domain-containing protein [Patulibacter sp.]
MPGAVERIVRSGLAYQASAFLSSGLAFFTYAAYNRAIGQNVIGEADLILAWLIMLSLFARLGFGEALLRHWFTAGDEERPGLQRTIQLTIFVVSAIVAIVVALLAQPITDQLELIHDPAVIRIAAAGLFAYTNLDIAQTLLRARDDRRTYFIASMSNVILTTILSLVLIVGLDQGVRGYLIGNYGASGLVVLWLWSRELPVLSGRVRREPALVDPEHSLVDLTPRDEAPDAAGPADAAGASTRPRSAAAIVDEPGPASPDPGAVAVPEPVAPAPESDAQRRAASRGDLRALLRFSLPTVPTDAAIFGFNLLDRTLLTVLVPGTGMFLGYALGVFSNASKIASGVILMARAFQLAFPPLAYGITDAKQASALYASAVRGYIVVLGGTVVGVALCAPWTVHVLIGAPKDGFADVRPGVIAVLPLLATAWAMWGVVPVMTTIAGRLGATRLTVPASVVGLGVNLVALLVLVPPYGAHGAAAGLVIAYVGLIGALNLFTRRYFPVAFDWGRIAVALGVCAAACLLAGPLADAPHLGWTPAGLRLLMFAAVILVLWRFALERAERDELLSFTKRVLTLGRRR